MEKQTALGLVKEVEFPFHFHPKFRNDRTFNFLACAWQKSVLIKKETPRRTQNKLNLDSNKLIENTNI